MSAEAAMERIPKLFDSSTAKYLKVKLGSPEGIEADKKMYEAQMAELKLKMKDSLVLLILSVLKH